MLADFIQDIADRGLTHGQIFSRDRNTFIFINIKKNAE